MKITVRREACGYQDDQVGRLEAEYTVEADATFSSLVQEIIASRFLQFTSTHDQVTGEANGVELVEIFSPYTANPRQPEFKVDPGACAADLLDERSLSFSFRHVRPFAP